MAQGVKTVGCEALEIPCQFGEVSGLCHLLILPGSIDDVIVGLDFLRDIGFSLTIGHEKLEVMLPEPKITSRVSRIQGKDRGGVQETCEQR